MRVPVAADGAPQRLVVGSWPGRSFRWNSFIAGFSDALEAAGCDVVEVDDPRKLAQRVDVLHIHWPEQVFWSGGGAARLSYRTLATLRALDRLQRSGVRLVWMVHNLKPHDMKGVRRGLWTLLSGWLARRVDGFMTLSPATVPTVLEAFPKLAEKPRATVWHPAYAMDRNGPDRAVCRELLGVPQDAVVYAFLGLLKGYKGVTDLIRVFAASPGENRRLVIAGEASPPEFGEQIAQLAASDSRIDLRLGRLSDDDLLGLATAADIIVLPFREYLHSGSMIYALSAGRPVITPSTPFADSLAAAVGPAWVRTYVDRLAAEDFVFKAPESTPDLASLSWTTLGEAAAGLYRTLVTSKQPRSRA